jgi:hypothetical protein
MCLAWVMVLAVGGCIGVPDADGPADTFGLDASLPPGSAVRGAMVFIIDGVNAEVFDEMLAAGELPAFQTYLVDRGYYTPRAVGNIPSVTLASLTSLASGQWPGHHGITGINWFDRNRLIYRNYETIAQKNTLDGDHTAPLIYERFPGRSTFSVFFQPHRGATKFIENWTSAGPPFFFGWYEYVDRLTLFRLNIVADVARTRREWPAVTICYLLAPDFRGYRHGVESAEYRDALRHSDRQIGRVLGDLERAGLLDELILAVASDHGMDHVTQHWDITEALQARGLAVAGRRLWEKTPFEDRLAYYHDWPAVLYGSGDRYWALCLRKPTPPRQHDAKRAVAWEAWPTRPTPADLADYPLTGDGAGTGQTLNLPAWLVGQEAVDVVAYAAGPNKVRVRSSRGEVELHQPDGRGHVILYRVTQGRDPLGWEGTVEPELLAGRPGTPDEWLGQTAGTDYPDLPAQMVALFRSPLAGDIAVFARPGWDFRTVHHAGHGGVRPVDMMTPLLLAGPGVPHRRGGVVRTVDLPATLLRLLGRPVPPELDGRPIFSR